MQIRDEIRDRVELDDSASESEQMIMYWLIRAQKPDVVVETGTHKGLTSLILAQALVDNGRGHLWTYDPKDWGALSNFDKFPEARERITYIQDKGDSCDIKEIDFAFIDGFHEEEEVDSELDAIMPLLNDKALVVFHDCGGDNVKVGVNASIEKRNLDALFIDTENTIRIYRHDKRTNSNNKN